MRSASARTLAPLYSTIMGDWAIGNGWLSRAQTVLSGAEESSRRGWVALDLGMFEGDRAEKHNRFQEALDIARRHGDLALELSTLAYFGASRVHAGDIPDGMRMLDEALAAVAAGEVEDFCVLEEVFCQLFSACEHATDVARADQWISVGEAIAERRGLPAVSAFCRTHYGGVLTAAGRWGEADEALTGAIHLWALGRRSQLQGGAIARLADLRTRQGRFEEAEALLDRLDPGSVGDAARALAAVAFARGELGRAREILEAELDDMAAVSRGAVPLLALLVEVHLAAGAVDAARDAANRIGICADCQGSDFLRATESLANGRLGVATGDHRATRQLRDAVVSFARAQLPLESAIARLELARAEAADDAARAVREARLAHTEFARLGATWHLDATASLLRSLGVKTASPRSTAGDLTSREAEVYDLLALGLSNPEIADRLYISRKTVEHHVGNVLAKLGLRSRAEVAAHAARLGPDEKPGPR